jgi:hypothetical protein
MVGGKSFFRLCRFHPAKEEKKSKQRMEMAALNLLMGRRAPLAFTAAQIYR